ncbi:MAG: Gfo/Idh/MocA family oxidoreductase [Chthonomonadales bacterium]|nr:Gfo/Idh/MocA family oxidoreductase [Chthonomonadales bacterium]
MDYVNIGVIGCGNMARDLARRCVKLGRCRVAAVTDPDPESLAAAASEFMADTAASAEELCNRPDVDAVIVGSPPGAHLDNVLAAAAARRPIFCEKPLGVTVAECDQMIAACDEAGVLLFVGQVLRLFPLFAYSRSVINEGHIGEPRAISVIRAGYGQAFHSGWRAKRKLAGGLLLEVNVHELDYMRFIMGEPVRVYALMDNIMRGMDYEDQAYVLLEFENGGTGCLHTSMSSPIGEYRVHLQSTKGNLVHGGFSGSLRYQPVDGQVTEVLQADISGLNPYDRELSSWIEAITNDAKPLFTGHDGRMAVAMAECAYRSADEKRPVAVSEVLAT